MRIAVTGESGGLLSRLSIEGPDMPEALSKIAEVILADPEGAAHLSILDLAERSGTSTATVTRFSRTLGFRGYANLRVAVATETGRAEQARWETDIGGDITPDDPLTEVLGVVAAADTRAIQDTAAGIDVSAVDALATAIASAGRVEIFGLGSSGTAGSEMAFRLERIRVPVRYRADTHTALTNAALLQPGDVAIALSHSGRTRDAIEMLAEAADHGALTVAVTSYARSPLAEIADIVFTPSVHETTFRLAALSALHSQLLILDLIYVAVAQRTFGRTAEALKLTARAVDAHRVPDKAPARKRGRAKE
ncbi:MurR/RpiR family transcriptional regulator [Streptomyces sp. NPDC020917]|uniref:MurR/RpiR family transcriptional regulator n=1 Tax=Streptomyces sp. NPDC020917 TaxID=3365102 RepID=UPI0037A36714